LKNIFSITILFFVISFAGAGPVSYYGELKIRPNTPFIYGAKSGARAQIRGVSFGWTCTTWESSRFYNANAVERMAKDWKAEVVRAAYGITPAPADSSTCFPNRIYSEADAMANRNRIETIVDAAIEQDVFAIIDWHSHNAHNETQQAKDFFAYMAEKYGKYDNVIFELYNEPLNVDWEGIKAYAEDVIPIIRKHSDNLILIGTPFYSQKVQDAIGKKIKDPNLGYVLHFYAASHNAEVWRSNMINAINDTMPLFITEYGTTHADGGQSNSNHYNTHNAARSDAWHVFMDSRKISSVAWNINDKYEGSAFFGVVSRWFGENEQSIAANWSDTAKMTESGKYIFRKLNEYYNCVPWNPERASSCSTPLLPPANQPLLPRPGTFYEIFSMQGKKVGELLGNYQNADALNLKNGVYILILRQNGAVQTKTLRIVK
jgi:hypothetical protein